MMPDDGALRALLRHTLTRLQDFGVRQAVLFTGHFADEQRELIAALAAEWNSRKGALQTVALGVNGNKKAMLPDHAGRFETTLLAAFHPQTVDMAQLPPAKPEKAGEDPFGAQRHAPGHSLRGIFGPDPRDFVRDDAPSLRRAMAVWLAERAGRIPSGRA